MGKMTHMLVAAVLIGGSLTAFARAQPGKYGRSSRYQPSLPGVPDFDPRTGFPRPGADVGRPSGRQPSVPEIPGLPGIDPHTGLPRSGSDLGRPSGLNPWGPGLRDGRIVHPLNHPRRPDLDYARLQQPPVVRSPFHTSLQQPKPREEAPGAGAKGLPSHSPGAQTVLVLGIGALVVGVIVTVVYELWACVCRVRGS